MMEIQIQVAVRVFPSRNLLLPSATPPIPERPSPQLDVDSENNNNNNDEFDDNEGNNGFSAEGLNAEKANKDVVEEVEGNGGQRYCVHAIPLAAAAQGHVLDNGNLAAGLMQVGPHSFPVTHALPLDCSQAQIYAQTVYPLISLFFEGFDSSVVTYGQRGMGKSYTLFGPGFDCVYGEADQGLVQRCVREMFAHMANHAERTYIVNVGWVEICGETIRDLLGVGNVQCDSITDVFHWLQLGMAAKASSVVSSATPYTHSLFTLTLEQQWVSPAGLIQHRLSTASFSDLCATDRVFMLLDSLDQPRSLPKDQGLQALEQVVSTLTDPTLMCGVNGSNPYNQTTLTTLLKDSFGGRAQTLIILCISPLERDYNETICNLQFAFKAQCVRNFVIMNTFSDDNTPISPDIGMPSALGGVGAGMPPTAGDHFGLQFAASQWFKLVSNAEGLFSKLVSSTAISALDKEQIEEWLFLKQECEECLSSSEALRSQKQLGPIQEEAEEPEECNTSEPDTSCQQNSDNNESDSESQRPDLEEKLDSLMDELRVKTDTLVRDKYKEFIERQPKAVMQSQEESVRHNEQKPDTLEPQLNERKASVGGRRRSIQPGASLSSAEITMLNRVATRSDGPQQQVSTTVPQQAPLGDVFSLDSSGELQHAAQLRAAINSPLDAVQKKLRKLDADIEARQRQIKELEQTMQLKQNIITELVKNSDTRTTAKQRAHKKRAKLDAEYEKTKKQLAKALVQGKERVEVERLRTLIASIEQRLQDLTSIKHIAGESGQKVKKLQQSLHESKKFIDELQKKLKKERKVREQLDGEMRALRAKEQQQSNKALVKLELGVDGGVAGGSAVDDLHLETVQARISHVQHVLREKSDNLQQYVDGDGDAEQREGLRHEIRNLRRTRDHLLEQRCMLDRKLKRDAKALTHREERKLLECDEAIEAIDAAIEFKNEMICGDRRSIDTSERLQREKGEKMLMARLNKLSPEEMRTLLYKYFVKVIDLRDSSRKLELQLMQLERDRDAWEWKERVLSNAVRQARLEGERNAVLLQRQHEIKLTLMMRHLAEETSAASSASFSDQHHHHGQQQDYLRSGGAGLVTLAAATGRTAATTTTSSQFSDSDFDLDFYKSAAVAHVQSSQPSAAHGHKMLKPPPKHHHPSELELCPALPPPDALAKYKPLDKLKDKERESKNKLFAKFQVLTRYAGQSMAMSTGGGGGGGDDNASHNCGKKAAKDAAATVAIPQENLKRLISTPPATKVTRQKNKIIIQDASRKN